MRAALLAVLLSLSTLLAGCVNLGALDAAEAPEDLELPLRPWLDAWTVTASNFTIDYDPDARHVAAEGTLRLLNELDRHEPTVTLRMEAYRVTSITDEAGNPLEFTTSPAPMTAALLPEELWNGVVRAQRVEVELTGDTAPGTEREIRIGYEGWSGRDANVPGGAPNDFGANLQSLVPVTTGLRTLTDTRFTLHYPSDWVVLAAAGLVDESTEGDRTTARYQISEPRAQVFSAQGLEWHEDEVDGIDVRTYFYPDMRVQGRAVHDVTVRALRLLPNVTGPYPYDHLWTVPHQVAANAFSTPGLTFMGLNFYRFTVPQVPVQFGRLTPYAAGRDSFEMVVVHEHAHNWWGHNVRGNNTDLSVGPRDTWISEGITTYLSELVWFDHEYGPEDAAASSNGKVADQQRRKDASGDEPGVTEAGGDYYEKTALMLRALEAYAIQTGRPDLVLDALHLGQERFGRLTGGIGTVDTEAMVPVFEEAFDEDLRWHFDPWLYSGSLADFRVAGVKATGDGVTVTVENAGDVPAAVLVHATTLTGRALPAWGFVAAGERADVLVERGPAAGTDPVVRVTLDPFQHVYEADEANNAWTGTS